MRSQVKLVAVWRWHARHHDTIARVCGAAAARHFKDILAITFCPAKKQIEIVALYHRNAGAIAVSGGAIGHDRVDVGIGLLLTQAGKRRVRSDIADRLGLGGQNQTLVSITLGKAGSRCTNLQPRQTAIIAMVCPVAVGALNRHARHGDVTRHGLALRHYNRPVVLAGSVLRPGERQ